MLTAVKYLAFAIFALNLHAGSQIDRISRIAKTIADPDKHLEESLIVVGSASLDTAKIIFLPEVHDDPESLLTQLLVIAREKNKGTPFIVLDESLTSMQKSIWDVFSQKSLEIIAAEDQRRNHENYAPKKFEMALQVLANKFRQNQGQLKYIQKSGLWVLADFLEKATPFFGWDIASKASLTKRNVEMVASLKSALKNNDRVLVMLGARHVPELEYMTSKKFLCNGNKFNNLNQYFSTVKRRFGPEPNIRHGIGATTPIHAFLAEQPYAVAFKKELYNELDRVVKQFRYTNEGSCIRL